MCPFLEIKEISLIKNGSTSMGNISVKSQPFLKKLHKVWNHQNFIQSETLYLFRSYDKKSETWGPRWIMDPFEVGEFRGLGWSDLNS